VAAKSVRNLKVQLLTAVQSATTSSQMTSVPHNSIKDLKAALQVAVRSKDTKKKLAMSHPDNKNLDAFRGEIRKVHSLQTQLLMAKQEASLTPISSLPSPAAPETSVLKTYCSSDKHQDLCKFYKVYQNSGWQDKAGKVGKHLLSKVAESRKHVGSIEQKLTAAKATSSSKPSTRNQAEVKALSKQLNTARASHQEAAKMVSQFMDHQTQLGHKMKQKSSSSHMELVTQIGQLIKFYCSHNSHAKLCNFYKGLQTKHTKDVVNP